MQGSVTFNCSVWACCFGNYFIYLLYFRLVKKRGKVKALKDAIDSKIVILYYNIGVCVRF